MSKKPPAVDPKATITVSDYLTIERLVRERPSLSSLEKSVQLFPTCAIFWSTYLDFLIETPDKALKVAERAVAVCPHIDLWKRYLGLAKMVKPRLPDFYPVYEKAISAAGNDPKSSDMWIEYIYIQRAFFNTHVLIQNECLENPSALPPHAYLLPLSPTHPAGLTEDALDVEGIQLLVANMSIPNPTIASIRELFQSALSVPMEKLDAIYDEYQSFEQVIATALVSMAQNLPTMGGLPPPQMMAGVQASKLLSEYSTRWIQSKNGLREIQRIYSDINLYFAPIPLAQTTAQIVQGNIFAWRRVLKFEKTNPFKLTYKRFRARMAHVFSVCMMSNVYVSEFWLEHVVWLLADEGVEPAFAVLEKATKEYLAHDVLLRLVRAYLMEESGNVPQAMEWYTESLAHYTAAKKPVPSLLMHQIRFACRALSAVHGRNIFLDHVARKSIHIDVQLVIAFAKLELRMMKNIQGSIKVLQLGLSLFPASRGEIEKALIDLKADVIGAALTADESGVITDSVGRRRMGNWEAPILSMSIEKAKKFLRFGPLGFLDETPVDDDVINLEESEESVSSLKRPDPSRMMAYKPGMENSEEPINGVTDEKKLISKPLRSLQKLLPVCHSSSVPETDIVIKTIQTVVLPDISVTGLRRLDEDPVLEQLRREREEGGVLKSHASLKRLLPGAEQKADANRDDDVIIKSDLMDEEREQREFLSALASNIHRERVYYKRHKLISF